ncbi:MAG: beta-galactosidase [Bacteroidales bacterium]|nr:beta-galactosidase [Bacteroidales bacterium]
MKKLTIVTTLLLLVTALSAQPQKFSTILYGVAYYHEYMPYERLEADVKLMQDAGISVVRLGESSWSLFEPQEGVFEFAWMDRIIDRLHKAGIKVILGTPTYSIPAWLAKKYPDIFVERLNGTVSSYGIRQNFDITNPAYLFHGERVIRKMMEHYAKHPAIIGYQVDNETSTYGAANYDFFRGFVDYMKAKYKTTDTLNKLWGLNYWGMTLNDWDEFPTRHNATNPSYKLEWDLYNQKVTADYLTWQAEIVGEYKRPDQFITHCFMPSLTTLDQYAATRKLDMPSLNVYHGSQNNVKGEDVMWADDFYRSLRKTNHLITETNAQTIGWDSKGQYPPFDGQGRLFVYSHIAGGANMVEYWHWHSIHYGQETYWKGVLGHDLEPNRFYNEVSQVAHELQKIGPKLVNLKIKNKAAILYSRQSDFGISYMPFKEGNAYMEVLRQMHRAAFKNNVGVDFVVSENADFAGYDLLMVPPLYVASDELLKKIADFVKNGGHVIMSVKSGFTDENSVVRHVKAPGPLREAAGFYYQEFSSINTVTLLDDPFKVGKENNTAKNWIEFIVPETAKPMALYDDPFFKKYPAITENKYGKGSLTYEGCLVSDEIQSKIVSVKAQETGLIEKENPVTYPIVLRTGTNDQGKTIRYYLNYSDKDQSVTYKFNRGTILLTGASLKKGDTVILKPWDVVIIED